MATELTDSGFQRDNLTTLIVQEKQNFIAQFGSDISTADDSLFGQQAILIAERRDNNYQLLEAAISSQTLSGAEGVYLDNILGKYVPRQGKQPASGVVAVETDNTTLNNFTLPADTNFTGGGQVSRSSSDTLLTEVVIGYNVTLAQMQTAGAATYEFTVKNTTTNALVTTPFTLTDTTTPVVDQFFNDIAEFIRTNTAETFATTFVGTSTAASTVNTAIDTVSNSGGIARFNFTPGPTLSIGQQVSISGFLVNPSYNVTGFITDSGAGFFEISSISFGSSETIGSVASQGVNNTDPTLYSGFNQSLQVVGWPEATEFRSSPLLGNKFNSVNVTSIEPGFFPIEAFTTFAIAPSFTGLQSATNPTEFASGSNVETDAEYTARYFSTINRISACTRDAIADAVAALSGVEAARIYPNPTNTDTAKAAANTFNTVVIGGTAEEINQAIYDTKPIGDATEQLTGNITTTIDTADGSTEDVNHTAGSRAQLNIRVDYEVENRQALSDSEQSTIIQNLVNLSAAQKIGDTLYNIRLQTSVLTGVTSNRITSLSIQVKRTTELDAAYSTANFVPLFNELPTIESSAVFFNQII